MFTITTTQTSNASGAGVIVAKGHGRQRTHRIDPSKSQSWNEGAACGLLANVLLDDRQRAMVQHPSGGQRVERESLSDAGGKHRWTIKV